jgi:hypothetical protein
LYLRKKSNTDPCYVWSFHCGTVCPWVADGGNVLRIWRAAANIMNKRFRTADKGWFPAWGLGEGLTTPRRRKKQLVTKCYTGPRNWRQLERTRRRWKDNKRTELREIGWEIVGWMHLVQDRDRWLSLVNTVMNFRVV